MGKWLIAFLITSIAIPLATAAKIPDHIVLYFNFDKEAGDKVTDRSIYGNDGQINGDVEWVDGKHGGAIKLDGSKAVITVPNSDQLKELKPPMSVGMWVQPLAFPVEWQCLIEMEARPGDRKDGWKVGFHNQNPVFTTYGHKDHFADQIVLNPDEWVYLVVTTDGKNVNFYLNGDLAQQVPFAGTIDVTQSPGVNIGAEGGRPGNWYCQVILDELWVSNKMMSEDEIKAFMEPEQLFPVDPRERLPVTWAEVKEGK